MKLINYLIIFNILISLNACSPDNSNTPKLLEEQRNTLDKAKEVENKVIQQTQDLRQDLEKQSQ